LEVFFVLEQLERREKKFRTQSKGRLIVSDMSGVELLVAFDVLSKMRDAGKIPDTLIFVSHGKESLSLGKYEDLDEIRYKAVKRDGVLVGRRESGAGTYYAPKGQIAAVLVTTTDVFPNLEEAERIWAGEVVLELFMRVGVLDAYYSHPGDIRKDDKKLGGSTSLIWGKGVVVGTFINRLTPSVKFFTDYYVYPEEKLKDKLLRDVTMYAGSMEKDAPRTPTEEEVKNLLLTIVKQKLGMEFAPGNFTEEEKEMIAEGFKKLTAEDVVTSVSKSRWYNKLPNDWRAATFRYKSERTINASVAIDKTKKIRDILITGDFLLSPADGLEKVVNALKGISAENQKAISNAIVEAFKNNKMDYTGFTLEEFTKTIIEAAVLALQQKP
jgi:lipoate-protein ligase A